MTTINICFGAALCSGAMVFAVSALGQASNATGTSGQTPGSLKTITLTSSLRSDDNYDLQTTSPGNALIWDNILTYTQQHTTALDYFEGSAAGTLRAADLPVVGQDTSFDDGTVELQYGRTVDDNNFGFQFFFNDADIEFLDPLNSFDDDGAFDDTLGEGRRALTTAKVNLALNTDGPLSLEISGDMRNRDYRDTSDPDLLDRLDLRASAELGFNFAPGYTAVLSTNYSTNTEEDDNLDREELQVQTGLVADLTPTTQLDARIGYGVTDATRKGESDKNEEGVIASLNLTEDMRNGSLSFRANSRITENGQRNTMVVGRDLDLPSGSLNADFGLTNSKATDIRPFANVFYLVEGPTSSLGFSMRQIISVDDDGDDVVNSSIGANYLQQVNSVSSWQLDATAGRQVDIDKFSTSNGTTRVTLTAQYNHSLTRNWALSTGYTHRTRVEDDSDEAQSNAVFVNLTRSFSAR